jgi:hypothetical protein
VPTTQEKCVNGYNYVEGVFYVFFTIGAGPGPVVKNL